MKSPLLIFCSLITAAALFAQPVTNTPSTEKAALQSEMIKIVGSAKYPDPREIKDSIQLRVKYPAPKAPHRQGDLWPSIVEFNFKGKWFALPDTIFNTNTTCTDSRFDNNSPALYSNGEFVYVLVHNYKSKTPHQIYEFLDYYLNDDHPNPLYVAPMKIEHADGSYEQLAYEMFNAYFAPVRGGQLTICYHTYADKRLFIRHKGRTTGKVESVGAMSNRDADADAYRHGPKVVLEINNPLTLSVVDIDGMTRVTLGNSYCMAFQYGMPPFDEVDHINMTWSGDIKNANGLNFADGPGTLDIYKNGSLWIRVEGVMAEGYLSGNGKIAQMDNKTITEGLFKGGILDGSVRITQNGDLTFSGNYSRGKKNGYGEIYSGRLFFKGEFKDGQRWNGESFEAGGGFLGLTECYWTYTNGSRSQDYSRNQSSTTSTDTDDSDASDSPAEKAPCVSKFEKSSYWQSLSFKFSGYSINPTAAEYCYDFKCKKWLLDEGYLVYIPRDYEAKGFWDYNHKQGWYYFQKNIVLFDKVDGPYDTLETAKKEICNCD